MKFQYVRQEHDKGCAVACIAMVLGKPYDVIAQTFEADFDRSPMRSSLIRAYICDHNFSAIEKSCHGYSDIRISNKRMISPFAEIHIVSVQPFADSKSNHTLVMDAKGEIFDPARPDNKEWDYYFVHHVVGFFRENKK